ncbi:MAG TPA: NTP transferase domain-containing protein [Polyangiaceae bacterium]|nr:NTP transferase domain-containing protein [Polyangiaceae bacterium]
MNRVIIGIFVGGSGKRMGGVAKGLLTAPASSETLVERLLRVCQEALPDATPYLVGQSAAYAALGLPHLCDEPSDVGPIGGLRSLLLCAQRVGAEQALALACDLPFIDAAVLRLLGAPLTAGARVPFVGGHFQPLSAAYAPIPTLAALERALAQGEHALRHVLEELGPALERVEADEIQAHALRDWDTPGDITR